MATAVTCPKCGKQAIRPATAPGQAVRCPGCGQPIDGRRQRMYLFERAYHDYRDRARASFARFLSMAKTIWGWFWNGRGKALLEIPLRIGLVLLGVGFALAYVAYERAYGREVDRGGMAAMAVMAGYVWLLAWGFKAPMHLAARTGAGAAAVAVLAVAAGAAATGGGVVFGGYLLALALLTGLSLLVFLPMRGLHGLWLVRRKITYECPYDDCSYQGLPIHVCGDCGHAYADLRPSFYGIFHHVCQHAPGRATRLPTMDFLGRNKLQRRCGRCGRPLILSSIGELAERPVFLAGGPSAGKSVFLRQAMRELCARIERAGLGKARIDSFEQQAMIARDYRLLDSGQVLGKTVGDVLHAFGLAVGLRKSKIGTRKAVSCLLYFYDPPGEDSLAMQRLGRKQVIERVSGIVLLADPFASPALTEYGRSLGDRLKPSPVPLYDVVAELTGVVNQMLVRAPNEKCRVPLAVVINKIDAVPIEQVPAFAPLASARPSPTADVHRLARQALEQLGERRSVQALDLKFQKVRYFACSSLGRSSDHGDTTPFAAVGVAEPLLWLLGLDRSEGKP